MKMNNNIEKIWEDLENDKSLSQGLLVRRYSAEITQDVFVAIIRPENYLGLATLIDTGININIESFVNIRDLNIDLITHEEFEGKQILLLKLLNNQYKDIFSVLCEDLISEISTIDNEKELVKRLLNRLAKWKSLFDKAASEGLSPEEQSGLFGELFFLRMFLIKNKNYNFVINSWRGPEKDVRDFENNNWAVEIKTTSSNNHQKLFISNERQLDTSKSEMLFLFHLSVEKKQNSGESLNQIITSVSDMLNSDQIALNIFRNKLILSGYFEHHKRLYDNPGYIIRNNSFYVVKDNFPRIEEKDIRNGVGDIKYTIIISTCQNYLIEEKTAFKIIK